MTVPPSFFGVQNERGWCPVILEYYNPAYGGIVMQAYPSTLDWLRDHFVVSGIFLESLVNVRYGVSDKLGNACFFQT